MSVYEHRYRPYSGALTGTWTRFLVIPRHNLRDAFKAKSLTAFFALSFLPPLVFAILIYLHHNVNAIKLLKIDLAELIPVDASFFHTFLLIQATAAFFLTLLVAPPLVSRDLANNALPLYLSRPVSRFEYSAGKMSVVVALLSLVTWVPALALFLLQAYLEGAAWAGANVRIAFALFVGSVLWILFLALLSQTLSAWFKWRIAASGGMVAAFIIPSIVAEILQENLLGADDGTGAEWVDVINPGAVMDTIWSHLFALPANNSNYEAPIAGAWIAFGLASLALAWLLSRKVRAYEVAR